MQNILFTFVLSNIYFFIIYSGDFIQNTKLIKTYNLYNSLTHGILTSICAYIDICCIIINKSNLIDTNYLINWHYFSLFYFLYDTHWCIYYKSYLYLVHHIVCIFILIYSFYLQQYGNLISITFFFGEISGPLFNIVKILEKYNYKTQLVFIIFASIFIFIRFIITPLVLIYLFIFLDNIRDKYIFLLCGILLLIGSISWVKGQFNYIKYNIVNRLN